MTTRRNRPMAITDAPERREIPVHQVEIRDNADNNTLVLTGYASTFEPYDMYGGPEAGGWVEQLDRNAFDKTLREKPDLHLLINHAGMPLARTKSGTLQLSVDDGGLKVNAELDRRDPDVQALEYKMRRGDMDEMSFAFRVKAQEWKAAPGFEDIDDESLRLIREVSLHKGDVSVVNFGANPTTHAEVKSIPEALKMLAVATVDDLAELRNDGDLLSKVVENLGLLTKSESRTVNIENVNIVTSDVDEEDVDFTEEERNEFAAEGLMAMNEAYENLTRFLVDLSEKMSVIESILMPVEEKSEQIKDAEDVTEEVPAEEPAKRGLSLELAAALAELD